MRVSPINWAQASEGRSRGKVHVSGITSSSDIKRSAQVSCVLFSHQPKQLWVTQQRRPPWILLRGDIFPSLGIFRMFETFLMTCWCYKPVESIPWTWALDPMSNSKQGATFQRHQSVNIMDTISGLLCRRVSEDQPTKTGQGQGEQAGKKHCARHRTTQQWASVILWAKYHVCNSSRMSYEAKKIKKSGEHSDSGGDNELKQMTKLCRNAFKDTQGNVLVGSKHTRTIVCGCYFHHREDRWGSPFLLNLVSCPSVRYQASVWRREESRHRQN